MLTIIDDVTRECLAAVPDSSLSGKRVVREMQALIARRGRPGAIVSDNVLCSEWTADFGIERWLGKSEQGR